MLFQDYHLAQIREGEKTVTRRLWKDNHARPLPGSIHQAVEELFTPIEETDCFIKIDDEYDPETHKQRLGDMTDEDAQAEGDYETVGEFKEEWIDLHGEWDPDAIVDVVPLEYAGATFYECAECGDRVGHIQSAMLAGQRLHPDCLPSHPDTESAATMNRRARHRGE